MAVRPFSAEPLLFSAPVLPDSDLEHSAEQLGAVGDDPADVDDQLLLENSLALATVSRALAVDDALDHAWRQRVGDHLLLLAEQTQGHLANTGSEAPKKTGRVACVCVCVVLTTGAFKSASVLT